MEKNRVMFFGAAIVGVVAIFLFSAVSFGAVAAPRAHAYAVGSVAPEMPAPASVATTTGSAGGSSAGALGAGGGSDVGTSLQNLISPFTGFVSSLKLNNNTTANTPAISFHGQPST